MANKRIKVLAATSQLALAEIGADVEVICDTVAEAKQQARHYLTEEYRNRTESVDLLGYSQVTVNGACVADYFAQGREA